MTAVAQDIGGFRLAFAIGAAVLAVVPGMTTAARVGALLWGFHTCCMAFLVPLARGVSRAFRDLRGDCLDQIWSDDLGPSTDSRELTKALLRASAATQQIDDNHDQSHDEQ